MSKLILPDSVEWNFQGQRVSSAAPSLSPQKRYVQDKTEFSRFKTRTIVKQGFDEQRDPFMDGEIPMESAEAQVGRPMKSDDIEKRLKTLNPNLFFEVSKADENKVGVYVTDRVMTEGRRFVVGMERGWSPEWTIAQFRLEKQLVETGFTPRYETFKKYTGEKRGWRKVLAMLIRTKLITRAGADKTFGLPRDSKRWKEYLDGY